MDLEITARLLLAAAIILAGLGLYWLVNRALLTLAAKRAEKPEDYQDGRPAILYFTTPGCVPCKTVQRPAIERIKKTLGEALQVLEIDASAQPEIAGQWGVLSVPTTFVLDAGGTPRYINHGVANADKLLKQLNHLH